MSHDMGVFWIGFCMRGITRNNDEYTTWDWILDVPDGLLVKLNFSDGKLISDSEMAFGEEDDDWMGRKLSRMVIKTRFINLKGNLF